MSQFDVFIVPLFYLNRFVHPTKHHPFEGRQYRIQQTLPHRHASREICERWRHRWQRSRIAHQIIGPSGLAKHRNGNSWRSKVLAQSENGIGHHNLANDQVVRTSCHEVLNFGVLQKERGCFVGSNEDPWQQEGCRHRQTFHGSIVFVYVCVLKTVSI